jgi:tRNA(Ile)-lysidine synthase
VWSLEVSEEDYIGQVSERRGIYVFVDREAIGKAPVIRDLRRGDRIRPLGFEGSRKISDEFGEAGMTISARKRLPILVDENGPLWVPGVCLDGRVGVKSTTKQVLKLTFGPARTQ